MDLKVRVFDKLALIPLPVLENVLDVAIGVNPLEAQVVPVDGVGWWRGEMASHCKVGEDMSVGVAAIYRQVGLQDAERLEQ